MLFRLTTVSDYLSTYISDTSCSDVAEISSQEVCKDKKCHSPNKQLDVLKHNADVVLYTSQAFLDIAKALSIRDKLKDDRSMLVEPIRISRLQYG